MGTSVFGRNLRALREDRDLTQLELAEILQVTPVTACLWETTDRKPKQKEIVELLYDTLNCTYQDLFGDADGYYYRRSGLSSCVPKSSETYAPVLGNIAAGDPREAIENADSVHWIRPDILEKYPDGFFLRISGDSMDRVLPDGSFAFVAPVEVQNNDIVAVKVNGDDATVKQIKMMDGFVILVPASNNPDHKRRIIDSTDPEAPSVRILGRVVWADIEV